jgi:ABC-type transporter Mla subunit MlaD
VAALKDAEQVTSQLDDLIGELRSELAEGDFGRLMQLSDAISERADRLAETFENMNDVLMSRLQELTGGSRASSSSSGGAGNTTPGRSSNASRKASSGRSGTRKRSSTRKRSGSRR